MKALSLVFAVLLCSGCTTMVTITGGTVTSIDDHTIGVELTTKEDLSEYQNSFWAIRVALAYKPQHVTISSSNPDSEPHPEEFVFTAQPFSDVDPDAGYLSPIDVKQSPDGLYTSGWSIRRVGYFANSGTKFRYRIDSGDEIRLLLRGGTMTGNSLRSNEIKIRVPIQSVQTTPLTRRL